MTEIVKHFWWSVDAILEDVSVTETVVWCQTIKFYHLSVFQKLRQSTRVTRLKIVSNMADPISLNENLPTRSHKSARKATG